MTVLESVSPTRLQEFFHPTSIALVGASDHSRWSVLTYGNLQAYQFKGPIYCVNPTREYVHGEKTYRSVLDIDKPVDLAYVMVSSKRILSVMEELSEAGIRNLVLLTSGFSEVGAEGKRLEQQVIELAKQNNQIILGPNGNGFVNVEQKITPYGLPIAPPLVSGNVGIVLQSGALTSSVLSLAQSKHVGLSLLVSVGNETMITVPGLIDYLIEDPSTSVIALFLESIRQPDEFIRVAKKALYYKKPLVVMKIGRSDESARSAMAHTGALVGNDQVNDAVFKQYGIIRVHSLEDLIVTAGLLSHSPSIDGRRMGVVTPSGGACDILSDRALDEGILLPQFSSKTIQTLKEIVPEFSSIHNPLDVTGYVVVDRTLMIRALQAVHDDEQFDFIVCLLEPPRIEPEDPSIIYEHYQKLKELTKHSQRPILFITNTTMDLTAFGRTLCELGDIHFLGGMEHGMTAIGNVIWWNEHLRLQTAYLHEEEPLQLTQSSSLNDNGQWSELQARAFLKEHQIPVVPGTVVTTFDEAIKAANNYGFPIAMKVQSKDILHKSDVGGVQLNVQHYEDVKAHFDYFERGLKELVGDFHLEGVLISPMRTSGVELLVGVIRDPLWGLTLAVGFGGVFVEIMKDTSIRVLPVSEDDILDMLISLKGFKLLDGARGIKTMDVRSIATAIHRLTLAAKSVEHSLQSLEINPLLIQEHRIEALDVLIEWTS